MGLILLVLAIAGLANVKKDPARHRADLARHGAKNPKKQQTVIVVLALLFVGGAASGHVNLSGPRTAGSAAQPAAHRSGPHGPAVTLLSASSRPFGGRTAAARHTDPRAALAARGYTGCYPPWSGGQWNCLDRHGNAVTVSP